MENESLTQDLRSPHTKKQTKKKFWDCCQWQWRVQSVIPQYVCVDGLQHEVN